MNEKYHSKRIKQVNRKYLVYIIAALFAGVLVACTHETPDMPHKKSSQGIDVSHHQGHINWSEVAKDKKADISFVYIKATDGSSHVDTRYEHNAMKAKEEGFYVGLYHFFTMSSDPKKQFENFKKALSKVDYDLIPLIDVETYGRKTGKELVANLKVFVKLVEKEYKVKPLIYPNMSIYKYWLKDSFSDYPFYLPVYRTIPPVEPYVLWQYTEKGSVKGFKAGTDRCKFHPKRSIDDILMPAKLAKNRKNKEQGFSSPTSELESSVLIDNTADLIVYYPSFSKVDLVTGVMPNGDVEKDVIFCCEAAYTGECLTEFRHSNIAGNHVSSGVHYNGYPCDRNTGAFVWYNNQWKFLHQNYSNELEHAAKNGGMGFGQELLVHKGRVMETIRKNDNQNRFRALCEVKGKLCVIDSRNKMNFGVFKKKCLEYGASEAIYLDMGAGWNHSWYRDENGNVMVINPKTHEYCTNWLTFYK